MSDTCELWANKTWHLINVEDALTKYAERELRCPECHGAVKPHKAAADGTTRAHFEHKVGHPGCSLGNYFNGIQAPHPKPLRP